MNQFFPRVFTIFALSLIFSSCHKHAKVQAFGEMVDSTIAFSVNDLDAKIVNNLPLNVTISGHIKSFCKADGCWIKLVKEKDGAFLVRVKNKSDFVGEGMDGKFAFVKGMAKYELIEAQGMSKSVSGIPKTDTSSTINSEPKTELVVEATGLMIR